MPGGMKRFLLLTEFLHQGRSVEELVGGEQEAVVAGHTCSL